MKLGISIYLLDYTGVSCNLIKDSCEEKVCKNGGTCQNKDLGFQCLCPGGKLNVYVVI